MSGMALLSTMNFLLRGKTKRSTMYAARRVVSVACSADGEYACATDKCRTLMASVPLVMAAARQVSS